MRMSNDPDRLQHTLETLREMRFSDVPRELLQEAVVIESQHQPISERDVAKGKLERLIERFLETGGEDA
jgi:hypothetical protein